MPPLLSKEEMNAMDYGYESDHDLIYTDMLEDIHDGSQSHPNVNKREARYKIRDQIRQKTGMERSVKAMQDMGKGLHNVFNTVVKEIFQELPPLGEKA